MIKLPQTEVQDEALRTKFREDNYAEKAPQWLDVDDAIMDKRMSEYENDWKFREWLS